MNKSELVKSMSAKSGMTQKECELALDVFMASVKKELHKGNDVNLVGFGAFHVKESAERKGRNPQTGEELIIPVSRKPVFKAGKLLKDSVN